MCSRCPEHGPSRPAARVRRGDAGPFRGRRPGRAAALALLCLLAACGDRQKQQAIALTGGDPERGRLKLRDYGCAACHTIPGVFGADALVGPPLGGIARRVVIAGTLPNTPDNLIRWLRDPPAINPDTLMPHLNVTESDARDMAGYLYTLVD